MPHGQNKDKAPTDQIGQKLKAVNIVEGFDSQAFKKILQDLVPQMVNSMSSSIKQAIDTSLGNIGKMLQDALQIFFKKNEQSSKQHTVSKPNIAEEESSNSKKIAPSV